jgi:hypothetical protein
MPKYQSVSVTFEHTVGGSSTRKVNRAILTVYGESEFAVLAELKRQYPEYDDITILDVEFR